MSIDSAKKRKGRPAVDTEAVNVRLSRDVLQALDRFIQAQGEPKITRPEAVRRLIELGLSIQDVPKLDIVAAAKAIFPKSQRPPSDE